MGLSCGARALKFCLFIFNLVFLICGCVCVGIGIWLVLDKYAVDNLAFATSKVKGYEKDDGLRDLKPLLFNPFSSIRANISRPIVSLIRILLTTN
ncbi:hypothetical protein L596_014042 [Steinernema carpocapsae]|uniref:Uncharacterized protein n=1 Tax=Steinernema carpocapsae TaxID=34508 RepID=A0A4U5NAA8_STECR|nr:hypothetical protein L596_014042 [Steinernema carpocapsae]